MNNLEINKIYCEDNMLTMQKMKDNFVDIVVTSPPYNIGKNRINNENGKPISKSYKDYDDNLTHEEYFLQSKLWIDELLRVTKYHVFWNIQEVTNNKGIIQFLHNEYKNNIKEIFIWAKTNPASCIVDTMCGSGYEYIFCFSHDNPSSRKFNYCDFSNRNGDYVNNVIIKPSNSDQETSGHSFAFGDWLPRFFIKHFSKEGDIVYDPFMGTGTTAKAAHMYKRKWIGSEITQEYVNLANKRLYPYLTQLTLF
jgi:site-specific DNA-methyltransferase (adenine-specific)